MDAGPKSSEAGPRHPPARVARPRIVCRRIAESDIEAVEVLLTKGFPDRSCDYWRRGLNRMGSRHVPEGYPRFGYALAEGDRIVGAILLILSESEDGRTIKGNVSSWYVEPDHRSFSHMLLAAPLRMKEVTWFNISPAPHTLATIEAQGFSSYAAGSFHALAAFGRPVPGATVRRIGTADGSALLERHASYGCLCFEIGKDGKSSRFVFQPSRLFRNLVPCVQLVYCDELADFVRFAGPLGRLLLRYGFVSVIVDANAPLRGLVGRYVPGRRFRYYRGPSAPRLGDLSDSELVLFGY